MCGEALRRALLADGLPARWLPLYERRVFPFRHGSDGHNFAAVLATALGGELETLHSHAQGPPPPALQHALRCAGATIPPAERKAGKAAWVASDARAHFLELYRDFVRRVILPRVDLTGSGRCGKKKESSAEGE